MVLRTDSSLQVLKSNDCSCTVILRCTVHGVSEAVLAAVWPSPENKIGPQNFKSNHRSGTKVVELHYSVLCLMYVKIEGGPKDGPNPENGTQVPKELEPIPCA